MVRKEAWGSGALLQAPGRQQPSSLLPGMEQASSHCPCGQWQRGRQVWLRSAVLCSGEEWRLGLGARPRLGSRESMGYQGLRQPIICRVSLQEAGLSGKGEGQEVSSFPMTGATNFLDSEWTMKLKIMKLLDHEAEASQVV